MQEPLLFTEQAMMINHPFVDDGLVGLVRLIVVVVVVVVVVVLVVVVVVVYLSVQGHRPTSSLLSLPLIYLVFWAMVHGRGSSCHGD